MALRSLVGGAIFADVTGQGLPLTVGLHGWGRDRGDIAPALRDLKGTTAALDLPGFGTSPPPPEPWGAADYARQVGLAIDELLDDLADADAAAEGAADEGEGKVEPTVPTPSRAVVVGHSMGGRVAVCLAAQRPDLVGGLVLAGVPLLRAQPAGKPKLAFRVMRQLHRWRLVSDGRMEDARQRYGSADYRAAQGVMRQVLVRVVGETYERQLAQLECPVELVWGALDTAAPVGMVRQAERLVPSRHRLEVVDTVGHDVHTARPELLRERAQHLGEDLRH
jgi:pimeloyl-ACP methyl ester carboxylesterase